MKKTHLFRNIFLVLIFTVIIVNTIIIGRLTWVMSDSMKDAIELNRPAKLSVITIIPVNCDDCFDIEAAYTNIKKTNILIENETRLRADDDQAKQLISQYNIQYLPTIIFTGEIKKDSKLEEAWSKIGEIKDDAVIFTALQAPYFSVVNNRIVGQVSITYINDKDCSTCPIYQSYVQQLQKSGVNIAHEKTLDYTDPEAKTLIQKYAITHIPTFIANSELALYEKIAKDWSRVGKVAEDGSFIATVPNPPYRDITSDTVVGLVSLTYLGDLSCKGCLTKTDLKSLFSRTGIQYSKENIVDIASPEGKTLIKKYHIEKVPTLILDKNVGIYPSLKQSWSKVGTIESDGKYIIRNLSLIRNAKFNDLTTSSDTSP